VCDAYVLKKNSTFAGRKCFVQQRRAGASHVGDARVLKKSSTWVCWQKKVTYMTPKC